MSIRGSRICKESRSSTNPWSVHSRRYTVSAKLKNDVVDLVKKEDIQAIGDSSFRVDLSLEADDVTFSLANDIKSGKGDLLINGKSIHKDPFKSVTYGPLLTDGSMTASVEAEFPWGKTKTAGVPIDDKEMELTLIPDQDTQEQIMNTIVKTTKQYSKALSDGNTAQMTEASAIGRRRRRTPSIL